MFGELQSPFESLNGVASLAAADTGLSASPATCMWELCCGLLAAEVDHSTCPSAAALEADARAESCELMESVGDRRGNTYEPTDEPEISLRAVYQQCARLAAGIGYMYNYRSLKPDQSSAASSCGALTAFGSGVEVCGEDKTECSGACAGAASMSRDGEGNGNDDDDDDDGLDFYWLTAVHEAGGVASHSGSGEVAPEHVITTVPPSALATSVGSVLPYMGEAVPSPTLRLVDYDFRYDLLTPRRHNTPPLVAFGSVVASINGDDLAADCDPRVEQECSEDDLPTPRWPVPAPAPAPAMSQRPCEPLLSSLSGSCGDGKGLTQRRPHQEQQQQHVQRYQSKIPSWSAQQHSQTTQRPQAMAPQPRPSKPQAKPVQRGLSQPQSQQPTQRPGVSSTTAAKSSVNLNRAAQPTAAAATAAAKTKKGCKARRAL